MQETGPKKYLDVYPKRALKFHGSFLNAIKRRIVLKNTSEQPVRFKIKTTAPLSYRVDPNTGVLDKDEILFANVELLPFQFDQNKFYNHKFKVFSIIASPSNDNLDWETKADPALREYKVLCNIHFIHDCTKKYSNESSKSTKETMKFRRRDSIDLLESEGESKLAELKSVSSLDDTILLAGDLDIQRASVESARLEDYFTVADDKPAEHPTRVLGSTHSASEPQLTTTNDVPPGMEKSIDPISAAEFYSKMWFPPSPVERDWAVEYIRSTSSVPPMIYLLIAFLIGSIFGMIFL